MTKSNSDGLTWFENETLGVKFALPTHPTVRQQLAYRGGFFSEMGEDGYSRHWAGLTAVLYGSQRGRDENESPPTIDWECETLPEPQAIDLDTATDPRLADIIHWAVNQAADHFNNLDETPKN